jgi:hypothetical protein
MRDTASAAIARVVVADAPEHPEGASGMRTMEGFSFLGRTLAMKNATKALVTGLVMLAMHSATSAEPAAEQVKLKDGSTLFMHPDGTGRMVDQHGKPMGMADGMAMETAANQTR